jgi:predicted ATPase
MLKNIAIKGYKSIRELNLELKPINVLIGANGAGKSNFISFFKLLIWIMQPSGQLQFFVGQSGGASSFLFDGAAVTPQLEAELSFEILLDRYDYSFKLSYAVSDTFIFAEEKFWDVSGENSLDINPNNLNSASDYPDVNKLENSSLNLRLKNFNLTKERLSLSGHKETRLIDLAISGNQIARNILVLIQSSAIYHFHDTSNTSRFKQRWNVDDNQYLKEDAGNLAPFLLRLRENEPRYYQRIIETLSQVAPFFSDFVLIPNGNTILLQWREKGTDLVFSPYQASDGTLRAMALVALLLQPIDSLPKLLILDEPELGLHPYAISIIGSLINSVANRCQVILATQSPLLVDCFDPEEIIVVERNERESSFKRLVEADLEDWLKEYSLSELWNKNVIGGRP